MLTKTEEAQRKTLIMEIQHKHPFKKFIKTVNVSDSQI
jgi:hypothetical protein